jgi:hypothetical protein
MLASVNVEIICLDGLKTISVDATHELSKFTGRLYVATEIENLISKNGKTKK